MKQKARLAALSCAALVTVATQVRSQSIAITEWMYNGASGAAREYVEFTNIGSSPVSINNWSFDDDSRSPGSFQLGAGAGTVQPGESFIVTEVAASTFRTFWNLASTVKVFGSNSNNLGRADEINLYNASNQLVARLSYNDQSGQGPRTQGNSGSAPLATVQTTLANGASNSSFSSVANANWVLASVGDAYGSYTNTQTEVGNPGKYTPPASSGSVVNFNVPSNTSDTDGINAIGGTTGVVQVNATVSNFFNKGAAAISVSGSVYNVANSGLITSVSGSAQPAFSGTVANTALTNNSTGSITATGSGYAVQVGTNGQVLNSGLIDAAANHALRSTTIRLSNTATGTVRATGANDAVNLSDAAGTNFIVNDGKIIGGDDGIKSDGNLFVTNNAGGSITSGGTAISIDKDVTVLNYGLIEGAADSGVSGDGNGTVTNYGTIRGKAQGGLDGDGVDIDLNATITNYGTIDASANPAIGEGVTIGQGRVTNASGATISGGFYGIHVVGLTPGSTPPTPALGPVTITNDGTISSVTAEAIYARGSFGDSITSTGTITTGGSRAIFTDGGNDSVTISGGSVTGDIDLGSGDDVLSIGSATIQGTLRGGSGTDRLRFTSGGVATLGNTDNSFENIAITSGATLSPGGAGGGSGASLTLSAALVLEQGSSLRFDLGATPDQLMVNSLLAPSGNVVLTLVGAPLTATQPFVLISTLSGIASSDGSPVGWGWTLNGGGPNWSVGVRGNELVVYIPEPGSAMLLVPVAGILRRRRGR